MFIDAPLAARIDAGEARLVTPIARTLQARGVAVDVIPLAGGVALLAERGSPVNKIIGVTAVPDDAALAAIEQAWWARGETVRFEVSTLADPAVHAYLTGRGYRLLGFENVLVRGLADLPAANPGVAVARVEPATAERWVEVSLAGWTAPDGSGVSANPHTVDGLATVFRDFVHTEAIVHYLASIDGVAAGSGGAYFDADGLAYLVGASTVPASRRRGVQRAILAARLADAARAGGTLAVVTTAPGSQSQANVMRAGFALGYSRAVLVRPPPV